MKDLLFDLVNTEYSLSYGYLNPHNVIVIDWMYHIMIVIITLRI